MEGFGEALPPQDLLFFSPTAAAGYPLGVAAVGEKTRFLEGHSEGTRALQTSRSEATA